MVSDCFKDIDIDIIEMEWKKGCGRDEDVKVCIEVVQHIIDHLYSS